VRGGSEAENDHVSIRGTESWYGAAPVLFVRVGCLFLAGDLLSPLYEARAAPAGGYLPFQLRYLRERLEALSLFLLLIDPVLLPATRRSG
jgi:hypothetical protein